MRPLGRSQAQCGRSSERSGRGVRYDRHPTPHRNRRREPRGGPATVRDDGLPGGPAGGRRFGGRTPRVPADLPPVTAAVSVALTGLLARQFLERRKRHQLVWTVSLALLGLAAVLAFLGNADVVGGNAALYRLYLPLTALPVGLIGFGVLLLFRNYPKVARAYGYYWLAKALPISGGAPGPAVVGGAGLNTW